ncbi:hypothetical protein M431DRAFT_512510, partial [Trichoderma harzianum CBS 226.95]
MEPLFPPNRKYFHDADWLAACSCGVWCFFSFLLGELEIYWGVFTGDEGSWLTALAGNVVWSKQEDANIGFLGPAPCH